MRWPLLLGEAYVIVTVLLIIAAASRSVFGGDPPRDLALTKHELFWTAAIVALMWPFALLSRNGRRVMHYLLEGEEDQSNG